MKVPFYKKWWFIGACFIVFMIIVFSTDTGNEKEVAAPPIEESYQDDNVEDAIETGNETDLSESPEILENEEIAEPEEIDERTEDEKIRDDIILSVKAEFGIDNYDTVNYNPDNNFLLIKAIGKENLNNKMTVKGMFKSISDLLAELKELENIDVDFNIMYPLVDSNGNTSTDIVIKATYKWSSRKDVDSFNLNNVTKVADDWWLHPVLESALE